jgi:RNA polymerase sigma-70 factor (ECF subfamily)
MERASIDIFENKSTFEQFFKEQYSALCRFAFSFLKDADDAEEVVQNCFVKLWNDKDKLHINTSKKAYIYASVRNACLNQIKHINIKENYKQHNQSILDEGTNMDGEIEANELQEKIDIAIDHMPSQRQKIFKMSRFEGLKYKEIAEQLDISVKTVENHMGSAIKYLRQELKDYVHLSFVIIFIEGIGDKLF